MSRVPIHPVARAVRQFGVTQKSVAQAAGISAHTLSLVVTGHLRPSTRVRRAVAEVLGMSEAVLFDRSAAEIVDEVLPTLEARAGTD